ncbi:hypothetical protein [Sulfitobacter sp. M22]|uniref:hypothetical protein n=1 Tax=Sulfitobacter sp. M22 TaxID=2675332 RepID=UPI001F26CC80|nr:hypothetical protein [Sulfitobacter sp. M22]MCF7725785.1 hypothetical protein [Sulfitobacter sp. M22]
MTFFATLVGYMNSVVTWIVGQVEDITAIAMAGDLPPLTGRAGDLLRVKDDETGLEFLTSGLTGRAVLESESDAEAQGVMGLGELATRDFATEGEAQIGANNIAAITPLTLRQAFNAAGSAPVCAPRSWLLFNGITNEILASVNISSIADNAEADYTANFITPMPDVNYGAFVDAGEDSIAGSPASLAGSIRSTSNFRFNVVSGLGSTIERARVSVAIFR